MHTVTARRERLLVPRCDLDSVGVPDPEPALGHLRNLVAAALDLVLVVDDVPLRVHVVAAFDLDREPVAEPGDQRLRKPSL